MAAERCPNYEVNLRMCPCTSESCPNRGVCCLCLAAHRQGGSLTACLRLERPETTLRLRGTLEGCLRQEANREICLCAYDSCDRHAICCECLRNHWTLDGTGGPACMQ